MLSPTRASATVRLARSCFGAAGGALLLGLGAAGRSKSFFKIMKSKAPRTTNSVTVMGPIIRGYWPAGRDNGMLGAFNWRSRFKAWSIADKEVAFGFVFGCGSAANAWSFTGRLDPSTSIGVNQAVTTGAKRPVILSYCGASCIFPVLASVIPSFKWRAGLSSGFVGVPRWREARWLVRVLVVEPEVGPDGLELLVRS